MSESLEEIAKATLSPTDGDLGRRLSELLIQAKLPVFAVLDGAKFDDLPYALMRLDLANRPLYSDRGSQTRDFDQTSPRLVWLDRGMDGRTGAVEGPCSPYVLGQVMQLVKYDMSAASFWVCGAGSDSLYRHLRRINMVRVPTSSLPTDSRPREDNPEWQTMLFRHADGNVLAQVVQCLSDRAKAHFLGPAQAVHFAPDPIWSEERIVSVISTFEHSPSGMLTLDAQTLTCIEGRRKQRMVHFVRAELKEYQSTLSDYNEIIDAACRRAVAYGFETIDDVLSFARTECEFGPRFEMMPAHAEALYYLTQSKKAPAERIYYARRACLEAEDWNGTSV